MQAPRKLGPFQHPVNDGHAVEIHTIFPGSLDDPILACIIATTLSAIVLNRHRPKTEYRRTLYPVLLYVR